MFVYKKYLEMMSLTCKNFTTRGISATNLDKK
jgi:hypothetical protein